MGTFVPCCISNVIHPYYVQTRDLVASGNISEAVETSRSARVLNRIAIAIGTFVIAAIVTAVTIAIISSGNDSGP